ncbi:hypothetical protein [Kyrpidia tusciae]|uniref:DUF2953 domain-containing protein n=1 Tax=Kyrpidia tusciae (strain DSM 2912 / NBRC 15312 / T2) TaxID=562970 RepID=D5WRV3_KYRT2|nr:hypothetical protein [Kyrpidia tusciae]ADG06905.1 hypothetical protein Btus_2228 [Kyrpidia tusciae DSM 2912]
MILFLRTLEIAGWAAAGLLVLLLIAPWHLRGTGRVGAVLQGELSAAWCLGLVRMRFASGSIRLADTGEDPGRAGERDPPPNNREPRSGPAPLGGPGPAVEIRVAGIRVIRRSGFSRDASASGRKRRHRRRGRQVQRRRHTGSQRNLLRLLRRFREEHGLAPALLALRRLAGALHLQVGIHGTYATPDPALTGWLTAVHAVLGSAVASAGGRTGRKRPGKTPPGRLHLDVQPDFAGSVPELVLTGDARFIPAVVLIAALSLLGKKEIRNLLWTWRKTKRMKTTTKEAPADV